MDFLLRNYDINQYMATFAYHIALNDATMCGAYTGSTVGLGPNSNVGQHIKEYIIDIYDEKYPDFYELVDQLREDFKDYPDFTFGNIQRLINMTAKYMCQSTYNDPKKRAFFKNCHCPMNRLMIQMISSAYKQLMEKDSSDLNRDNYYFIVNGKESDAWDTVKWNAIDFDEEGINSIDIYKKYQEMARILAKYLSKEIGEEILPIELAFIDWDICKQ